MIVVSGCGQISDPTSTEAQRGPASLGPRLILEPQRIVLTEEEVEQGDVTKRFVLRNDGDQDLRILSVTTSCNCTTTKFGSDRIRPAEQAELALSIRPYVYSDGLSVVSLVSNDSESPERRVEVRWGAAPPLMMVPNPLDFGTLRPGESVDRFIGLERSGETETSEPPGADDSLSLEVPAPGQGCRLTFARDGGRRFRVTLTAGAGPDDYVSAIYALSHGERISMTTVEARARPDVWAEPESLGLFVKTDQVATRKLILHGLDGVGFEIASVSSEPPGWLERWTDRVRDQDHLLSLDLRATSDGRGTLNIRVIDGQGKPRDLVVPLNVVFTGS